MICKNQKIKGIIVEQRGLFFILLIKLVSLKHARVCITAVLHVRLQESFRIKTKCGPKIVELNLLKLHTHIEATHN